MPALRDQGQPAPPSRHAAAVGMAFGFYPSSRPAEQRYGTAASFEASVRALNSCPPDKLDERVKIIASGRRIMVPVTQLVYFRTPAVTQGVTARIYADIIREFERYHMAAGSRTARSAGPACPSMPSGAPGCANLEAGAGAEIPVVPNAAVFAASAPDPADGRTRDGAHPWVPPR